jgi:cathepsin A (carboxypeptidase C)
MAENGPCAPTEDGLDTVNNPYSWNANANIMWVDQPADVGYSYGNMPADMSHNESMVSENMWQFLQGFFEAFPEYQENAFFVFGESYGGHYAPAVSNKIYQQNKAGEGIHINLSGVGVGNGLTDPVVQYQYYPEMAMNNTYDIKTVSEEAYTKMVDALPRCKKLAEACQLDEDACIPADDYCNIKETTPYYNTGLNPYDIRKPCEGDLCYDLTNVDTFLNLQTTRDAIHVSEKAPAEWEDCNNKVNAAFSADWMRQFQRDLIPLLESDIDVLIYAGDCDFICNWMGNKAWTKELPWSGHDEFEAAVDQDWTYGSDATKGGMVRTAPAKNGEGSLTFLQVYEAGHMVPMDQPEAAQSLLNQFIQGRDWY